MYIVFNCTKLLIIRNYFRINLALFMVKDEVAAYIKFSIPVLCLFFLFLLYYRIRKNIIRNFFLSNISITNNSIIIVCCISCRGVWEFENIGNPMMGKRSSRVGSGSREFWDSRKNRVFRKFREPFLELLYSAV